VCLASESLQAKKRDECIRQSKPTYE